MTKGTLRLLGGGRYHGSNRRLSGIEELQVQAGRIGEQRRFDHRIGVLPSHLLRA